MVVRFFLVLSPVRLVFFLTLVTVIGAGDPDTAVSVTALAFDDSQSGASVPPLAGGE